MKQRNSYPQTKIHIREVAELHNPLIILGRENTVAKKKEAAEPTIVRTTDLAAEFGYSGPYLRKVLREGAADGKIQHEPRTRWEWEEGSEDLQATRDFLSAHKEAAEAAAAESDDEGDEDDDDLEEDEDE